MQSEAEASQQGEESVSQRSLASFDDPVARVIGADPRPSRVRGLPGVHQKQAYSSPEGRTRTFSDVVNENAFLRQQNAELVQRMDGMETRLEQRQEQRFEQRLQEMVAQMTGAPMPRENPPLQVKF